MNPFSNKDRFAIDVMREVPVDTADALLERYVNLSVKRSASWILNRLTVGTIVQLLKIDDKTKIKYSALNITKKTFIRINYYRIGFCLFTIEHLLCGNY